MTDLSKHLVTLLIVLLSVPTGNYAIAQAATLGAQFTIKGKLRGMDKGWVFFMDAVAPSPKPIDSAQVSGGRFEFKGTTEHPKLYYIGASSSDRATRYKTFSGQIMIDSGSIIVSGHLDSLSRVRAEGTNAQTEYNAYKAKIDPLLELSTALYGATFKVKKGDKRKLDSLHKLMKLNNGKIEQAVLTHVKQYRTQVSALLAYQALPLAGKEVIQPIFNSLDAEVQQSYYGTKLAGKLEVSLATSTGKIAPTFTLPTPAGTMIPLESYRGKYVLIDFWASWCGPCRAENPNLLMAYQKFRDKGFDILSISMDKSREQWLQAIKADKLPWTQVSDLLATNSPISKLYGIKVIPLNYLLDKNGKIIAANLRGGELMMALEDLKL